MSSFINLTRGKRVEGLMRYAGEYKFGPSYQYIEVPLAQATKAADDGTRSAVEQGAAGDFITLRPGGTINPSNNYQALIVVNGALAAAGAVSYQSILSAGDGDYFGASVKLHKAFNFKDLPWLFRIYLLD